MRHISEIAKIDCYERFKHYKYFNATTLGKCLTPNISGKDINIWLRKKGYIKKDSEDNWEATTKGEPFLFKHEDNEIIYWDKEILRVIEEYQKELNLKEIPKVKNTKRKLTQERKTIEDILNNLYLHK